MFGPVPLGEAVMKVEGGYYHVCALTPAGRVRCWGANGPYTPNSVRLFGRLGAGHSESIGDNEPASESVYVPLPGPATDICAGLGMSCALVMHPDEGQGIMCWGESGTGPLGAGMLISTGYATGPSAPRVDSMGLIPLPGVPVSLTCGAYHVCALFRHGGLLCWGPGLNGLLGRASGAILGDDETLEKLPFVRESVPVPPQLLPWAILSQRRRLRAVQGSAAWQHACARFEGGNVRCWGRGSGFELGGSGPDVLGDDEHMDTAITVPLGHRSAAVNVGHQYSCSVGTDGSLVCWGDNSFGQLGVGDTEERPLASYDTGAATAEPVVFPAPVVAVSAGVEHTCAVLSTQALYCWGSNNKWKAGHPSLTQIGHTQSTLPGDVGQVEEVGPVTSVGASDDFTCASMVNGSAVCWGLNRFGQIGGGAPRYHAYSVKTAPLIQTQPGAFVVGVSAGWHHACALFTGGRVACWGQPAEEDEYNYGGRGRLGYGNLDWVGLANRTSVAEAGYVNTSAAVVEVFAGARTTCVTLVDGGAQCWGEGAGGLLGYGNVDDIGDDEVPASVGPLPLAKNVRSMIVGARFTCAIFDSGDLHCWGSAAYGQRGDGGGGDRAADGVPMFLMAPVRYALDLGMMVTLGGIDTNLAVVGSRGAWGSVAEVFSGGDTNLGGLVAVPPWLLQIMQGAYWVDIPTPTAVFGSACSGSGMPTTEANGICAADSSCSVVPGGTAVQPWSMSCVWPEDWATSPVLRVDAVRSAADVSTRPRVPSTGGVPLALVGSFWPLVLQTPDPSALLPSGAAFWVQVGEAQCTGARVLSATLISCTAPALPGADVSGGVGVTLHHVFDSPAGSVGAQEVLLYAPPSLTVALPSSGFPQGGGAVVLRGEHLAQRAVNGSNLQWELPPAASEVFVANTSEPGAVPMTSCPLLLPLLAGEVRCLLGPGTGSVWLRMTVAGQTTQPVRVDYAVPELLSVEPAELLATNDSSAANLVFAGQNFGTPGTPLHASVAGIPCTTTTRLSATAVQCGGLPADALYGVSETVGAEVQVGEASAALPQAVRVVGSMSLVSLEPVPLPASGGLVTMYGVGLGRSPAYAGAGGDVANVVFGSGTNSVRCTNISADASQLTCQLPAGAGPLGVVQAVRVGGVVATLQGEYIQYSPTSATGVSVARLVVSAPDMAYAQSFSITGRNFASRSGAPDVSSALVVTVNGISCPSVEWVSLERVNCSGLVVPHTTSSPLQLQVSLPGLWSTTPLVLPAQTQPLVAAVLPPLVSAGGGHTIRIVGRGFVPGGGMGPGPTSFVNVTVGKAACGAVHVLSDGEIACQSPSLDAAGASSSEVRVHTAAGWDSGPGPELLFSTPEVLRVQGLAVQHAVLGAPGDVATLTLDGLALGDPAAGAGNGSLMLGDMECRAAGGRVALDSAGRQVKCAGYRPSALPRPPPGGSLSLQLSFRTNEGVLAAMPAGALLVAGPPALTRATPSEAQPGAPLSVLGMNLGLSDADVVAVMVGRVQVPRSQWSRAGDAGIRIDSLPPPASLMLQDLIDVRFTVALRSGYNASTPASQGGGFRYLLPPQAPLTAPRQVCGYREGPGGATRVVFRWTDDAITAVSPVQAWVVDFAERPPRTTAGVGNETAAISRRVVPVGGATSGDVLELDGVPADCAHILPPTGPGQLLDVRVLDTPAAPLWLAVRAATGVSDDALLGPASPPAGPVFSVCSSSQYLATHALSGEDWSSVLCQPCPAGALCDGLPWEGMRNAAGFYRVPWSEAGLAFLPCVQEVVCPSPSRVRVKRSDLAYLQHDTCRPACPLPAPFVGSDMLVVANASQETGHAQGSSSVAPTQGFSESPTSTQISQCLEGHTGPLCEQCTAGYGRVGAGTCSKCSGGRAGAAGLIVLFALGVTLVVAWLLQGQVRTRALERKTHSVVKKVLLSHLQQCALMLSFDLKWPNPFRSLLQISDMAGSAASTFASVDCVRATDGAGLDSTFRVTVVATLVTPVLLGIGAVAVFWALWLCRRADAEETRRRCLVALVVLTYLFYTPISRATMQLFTCVDVGGQTRLLEDLSIECDSAENRIWSLGLGVPLLLLFVLGYPALAAVHLWREREVLQTSTWHRRTLGLLYLGYKDEYFWYEVAIMARKALFALVLVALRPVGLLWQIGFGLLVLCAACMLSAALQPYEAPLFNKLDMASMALSITTLAGGALLFQDRVDDLRAASSATHRRWQHLDAAAQSISTVLCVANAAFVGFVLVWWLREWYGSEVAPVLRRRAGKAKDPSSPCQEAEPQAVQVAADPAQKRQVDLPDLQLKDAKQVPFPGSGKQPLASAQTPSGLSGQCAFLAQTENPLRASITAGMGGGKRPMPPRRVLQQRRASKASASKV